MHNLWNDAPNYHVLDAVEAERLHKRLVVVEGLGRRADFCTVGGGLLCCLLNGCETGLDASAFGCKAGEVVGECLPAGGKLLEVSASLRDSGSDFSSVYNGKRLFCVKLRGLCLERLYLRKQGGRCGCCGFALGKCVGEGFRCFQQRSGGLCTSFGGFEWFLLRFNGFQPGPGLGLLRLLGCDGCVEFLDGRLCCCQLWREGCEPFVL